MAKKSGKSSAKRPTSKTTRKTAKKPAPKQAASRPRPTATNGPRRLKPPTYKAFRLQKRIRHTVKLPSVWRLTKQVAQTLWAHRRLFVGIILVYGLLNLVLVRGLASNTDIGSLKSQLSQVFTGHFGSLISGLSIFAVLVSSAGNGSSQTAGAYQLFLGLITSLAVIWALRQALSGTNVRIRDAYYRGMYPLIPFMLVLLVVILQLLPLVIGGGIYGIVLSSGIAVYTSEKLIFLLLFILLGLLSFYLITSSLFALYIVTLPDMTPIKALRTARQLVRHRRWTVLRKIICLPIILLIVAAIIMVPIIVVATALAQWIFFILTMFAVAAVHTYMYTLYRELLRE
jgi:hypothetical protein